MLQIFIVLPLFFLISIAQDNGRVHVITNDGPLRGRMPLPKEPGRYNMRFNPQTGQMEMVRIDDASASSSGGTSAVASGPLANAGIAASKDVNATVHTPIGTIPSAPGSSATSGKGSGKGEPPLPNEPGRYMLRTDEDGVQRWVKVEEDANQPARPTGTTGSGRVIGQIVSSDPQVISSGGGTGNITQITRDGKTELWIDGKKVELPSNGTLTLTDSKTGTTRTITRTADGNIRVTTVHKSTGIQFPAGTGPKEPLQVNGQTIMAPKGCTVVTDSNGQQVIRVPMGPRAFPSCGYSLHLGGPDGEVVAGQLLGPETIHHVWSCEEPKEVANVSFCLLVHSCKSTGPMGNVLQLIDSNGCSTNTTLLPQLTYLTDLKATTATGTDLNNGAQKISLACGVRTSVKHGATCDRPKC